MTVEEALPGVLRALLAGVGLAPSPDRAARALFAAGLVGIALLLLFIPCVPFQDLPNTGLVMLIDHSGGEDGTPYFRRPEVTSFGYILSTWMARLLLSWLSIDATLRWMCLAAAIALPLATARLAAVLGIPWALAGILALPLGLGWPLRMGFVSFVLGQPVVLLGTAAAVLLCRERSALRMAELALWAVAAYLLHAFAFLFLCALVVLAWLCTGSRSVRALASIVAALVPAGMLAASDVAHRALSSVIVRDAATPAAGISFRPLGRAFMNIASRSYGISGPASVVFYLPLIALLLVGITMLAARAGRNGSYWLALLGTGFFTLGSMVFPDSVGNVYLLGPRVNVIGMCFAAIVAAAGLSGAGARVWLAAFPLSLLACGASAVDIVRDSRLVQEVVGTHPPRSLAGHFYPVRAAHCSQVESYNWGNWDPLRHVWAYALSPASGAPYLFARHRYAPVWYRVERILPHPFEGLVLSDEDPLSPASCERRNRERIEGALTWPGYDGVVLAGRPEDLQRALGDSDVGEKRQLAPGIWKLGPETSRVIVDFGNPTAYRTERGGFGRDERREGRTVTWSDGPVSWLNLDLAVSATQAYRLRLLARPLGPTLPQTVQVEINGVQVASLDYVTADWREAWVDIPPGVLKSGRNRLGFAYARVVGPRDAASGAGNSPVLALLFDRLEIVQAQSPDGAPSLE
jgi:hypothetical protein